MPTTVSPPLAARAARRDRRGWLLRTSVLAILAVAMLLPFLWQVVTSLKTLTDVDLGIWPVHGWWPENYAQVFKQVAFARYYFNSILVTAAVTFLQVLTSACAAYAFSRLRWPGRDQLFLLYLATMMVPGVVLMIPSFWIILKLGLYNSYAGLVIPGAFSAFGTFLLRQFMLGIPRSLDEAAEIDGATEWQQLFDVILPLTLPGMIALAIFTFLGTYASFFWPLVIIKDEALRTLPIGMLYFNSAYGQATHLLMAGAVMSILPLIVVFVIFQRYLVSGIQLGAVKG